MILLQQSVCPSRTLYRKYVNGRPTENRIDYNTQSVCFHHCVIPLWPFSRSFVVVVFFCRCRLGSNGHKPSDGNNKKEKVKYMTVTNRVYVSTVNGEGTGKRIGDLRILGHSQVLVLSVDVFTALSNITYGNLKKDN